MQAATKLVEDPRVCQRTVQLVETLVANINGEASNLENGRTAVYFQPAGLCSSDPPSAVAAKDLDASLQRPSSTTTVAPRTSVIATPAGCSGPQIGQVLFESVVWAGGVNKAASQHDLAASTLKLAQSLFSSYQIGLTPVCAHPSASQVRVVLHAEPNRTFAPADCWLASNTLSNTIDANQFVVLAGHVTVTATKFVPLRSLEAVCKDQTDGDYTDTWDDASPEFKFASHGDADAAGRVPNNSNENDDVDFYQSSGALPLHKSDLETYTDDDDDANNHGGASNALADSVVMDDGAATNAQHQDPLRDNAAGGYTNHTGALLPKYNATPTIVAGVGVNDTLIPYSGIPLNSSSSTWGVAAGVVAAAILMVVILAM